MVQISTGIHVCFMCFFTTMKEMLQKISLFFFPDSFVSFSTEKTQSFNIGMEMKRIASCGCENLTAEICQECESSEDGGEKTGFNKR